MLKVLTKIEEGNFIIEDNGEIINRKKLTCYNQDLQRYNYGLSKRDFNKERKTEWMDQLKEKLREEGKSFHEIFPDKKAKVVDEIIYLLTASGINTISTKTLMRKCNCTSRTTIVEAVKGLKESGHVLVCQLGNNHCGTYVFVFKNHPNFKQIMREVFFLEVCENEENEQPNEQPNEQLQNPKSLDALGVEGDKSDPIHLSFLSFKQDFNYIRESIENESLAIKDDPKKEMDYIHTYYVNEFQFKMYYHIKSGIFHDAITEKAVILGLRVGSNCNYGSFIDAKAVVFKINKWIENGMEIDNIAALFSSEYEKELKLTGNKSIKKQTQVTDKKELPFYNWLES